MQKERTVVPAMAKTLLDEMTLLDRFLFNETVEDQETYNLMVGILLGEEIELLKLPETEKELRISPQLRQIRLDVVGMDAGGSIYQVEMQKKNTYNLRRRSRFYQGQIDVSLLEPGCTNFNELSDVTTILVAPFDIFGYGLYRYTFEGVCREVPELKLEDGARRIFINTHGKNPEKFSAEFLELMEYINATTDEVAEHAKSDRIRQIHQRVKRVRASEKMGVRVMQRWEELAYAREDGVTEGRVEGRAEGSSLKLVQLVCRKLARGCSEQEIAEQLEEELSEIEKICGIARSYAPEYDAEKITESYLKMK